MTMSWVSVWRLQKAPRNWRSSVAAVTRGCDLTAPTGNTVTPLSEIEYSVSLAELRIDRPARFSPIWSRSRTVRLSASTIIRLGGVARVGVGVPGGGGVVRV